MYSGSFGSWWFNVALVALLAGLVLAGGPPPQTLSRPTGHLAAERSPAEASRTYFRVVSQIISLVAERLERCPVSAAPAMGVVCLRQGAIAIDQVPTDTVDPDLVQWGEQVQRQMNQAARVCTEVHTQMLSRLRSSHAAQQTMTVSERSKLLKEASDRASQTIVGMLKDVQQIRLHVQSRMTQKYEMQF